MPVAKVIVNNVASTNQCSEAEKARILTKTRVDAVTASFLTGHKRNAVDGTGRNADDTGKGQVQVVQDVQYARRIDGPHAAAFNHKSEFAFVRFLHGCQRRLPKASELNVLHAGKQSAVCLVPQVIPQFRPSR